MHDDERSERRYSHARTYAQAEALLAAQGIHTGESKVAAALLEETLRREVAYAPDGQTAVVLSSRGKPFDRALTALIGQLAVQLGSTPTGLPKTQAEIAESQRRADPSLYSF